MNLRRGVLRLARLSYLLRNDASVFLRSPLVVEYLSEQDLVVDVLRMKVLDKAAVRGCMESQKLRNILAPLAKRGWLIWAAALIMHARSVAAGAGATNHDASSDITCVIDISR